MAKPERPERNRTARSCCKLRRFHRFINSDKVFGTHSGPSNIGEGSSLEVFVPAEFRARRRKPTLDEHSDERHEVLAAYAGVGMIHSRIVTVDALIRIAETMWAEARGR